jgi:hypothetical protein
MSRAARDTLADGDPTSGKGERPMATLLAGDFNVWSKDDPALQLLQRR